MSTTIKDEQASPLRASRIARGLSQPELAVRAGVGLSTVRRAEAGGPLVKDVATKLAEALGAGPEEVLEWREHAVALSAERLAAGIERSRFAAALTARYAREREAATAASHDASGAEVPERTGGETTPAGTPTEETPLNRSA